MNSLNKPININEYPNALAHLKVYPNEHHIEVIDIKNQGNEYMPQDKKSNRKQILCGNI